MTSKERDRYQAADVFETQAAVYDSWFENSLVYDIELAALKSLDSDRDPPKLEIGVGPGRIADDLDIDIGFDPARAPLILASERGISCCQAFGEELPVRDKKAGTIYILFTLCFVSDPLKVLAECSRVLKEKGILIIGMVPAGSVWGRSLASKGEAGHIFYQYAGFYTIEQLKKWLTDVKMKIKEYRTTLYQAPECVEHIETPRCVLDEQAGFAVIVAEKDHV